MINKKNAIALLFLMAFFIFVLYGQIRSYKYENELKENGKITIARIDSIFVPPKWSPTIYLTYYIDNKKCFASKSDVEYKSSTNNIRRFYEIKYLPNSPRIVRVNFSKEITDTLAILKAGFSREDIMNSNLGK